MTVENTNNTISYTGNGSSKTFAYDYLVYSTSHIKVYLDEVLQTVGYTVTDIGQDDGGNVIFSTAPTLGVEITLTRVVPYTQLVEYQEYGPFPPKTTERALDLLVMSTSQLDSDLSKANSRSLKVADDDPVLASGLVIPTNRFDKLLSFDIEGNVKLVTFDEDAAIRAEASAVAAAVSADEAEISANLTDSLYLNFRDDYAGHGPTFPQGENDGTLFYYDGPDFTQGLYITYASNSDPFTGTWDLVSGVGPQGAQGPEGIQGAEGIQGQQGIQGIEGVQGQQGIQGAIGDTGPAGIKGETGSQGQQGQQGIEGPVGAIGPQGVQGGEGPQGVVGNQGVQGLQGPQGDSFQVDEVGLLADRSSFDTEPEGFSYLATDGQVVAEEAPDFDRFTGDGSELSFPLSFIPDGQQSLEVIVAGVTQGPDNYTVTVTQLPELYTVVFITPPESAANILIRGFSIATGYGEIFFKLSNSNGDWSAGLPFGRGPRGDQGPQGVEGVQGLQGVQGSIGQAGPTGPQGPQGLVGPQGQEGDVGPQGQEGPGGDRGPDGIQGAEGPRGTTGPQGEQGITGSTGPQGAQGPVGSQGARGDTGAKGPTGANGSDGADGRSSSGRIFSATPKQFSGAQNDSVTFDLFKTIGTQNFLRTLKITGLKVVSNPNAWPGSVDLEVSVNIYGGNLGTTSFSKVSCDIPGGSQSTWAVDVPPIYLDLPADKYVDGDISVKTVSPSTPAQLSIRGATGSGTTTQYLIELIPESNELGDR